MKTLGFKNGPYRLAGFGNFYRYVSYRPAHVFEEHEPILASFVGSPALFVAPHRIEDALYFNTGDLERQSSDTE